jgi:hypothetical protein
MGPIACDMTAFTPDERRRYDALRARVTAAFEDVAELSNGYRVRLGSATVAGEVAEWMTLEQRCCPFIELTLQMKEGGTVWLELTGRPGVKEVLASEFAALRVSGPRTNRG